MRLRLRLRLASPLVRAETSPRRGKAAQSLGARLRQHGAGCTNDDAAAGLTLTALSAGDDGLDGINDAHRLMFWPTAFAAVLACDVVACRLSAKCAGVGGSVEVEMAAGICGGTIAVNDDVGRVWTEAGLLRAASTELLLASGGGTICGASLSAGCGAKY